MPGLTPSLRARSCNAPWWAAMLLSVAGLAATGSESVSFGHQHLAGGHALHHHHFFFGAHEHPGEDHDHDRDHDHDAPDHDHDNQAPAPRRTATVSAAPALGQPVAGALLIVHLAEAEPVDLSISLPPVMRPAARLSSPRGPPHPPAVPGSLL